MNKQDQEFVLRCPAAILGGTLEALQELHSKLPAGASYLTEGCYKGEREASLIVNTSVHIAFPVLMYLDRHPQESIIRLDKVAVGYPAATLVYMETYEETYLGEFKPIHETMLHSVDGWVKFKGNYYSARR